MKNVALDVAEMAATKWPQRVCLLSQSSYTLSDIRNFVSL